MNLIKTFIEYAQDKGWAIFLSFFFFWKGCSKTNIICTKMSVAEHQCVNFYEVKTSRLVYDCHKTKSCFGIIFLSSDFSEEHIFPETESIILKNSSVITCVFCGVANLLFNSKVYENLVVILARAVYVYEDYLHKNISKISHFKIILFYPCKSNFIFF